jgi:hypothetical protein
MESDLQGTSRCSCARRAATAGGSALRCMLTHTMSWGSQSQSVSRKRSHLWTQKLLPQTFAPWGCCERFATTTSMKSVEGSAAVVRACCSTCRGSEVEFVKGTVGRCWKSREPDMTLIACITLPLGTHASNWYAQYKVLLELSSRHTVGRTCVDLTRLGWCFSTLQPVFQMNLTSAALRDCIGQPAGGLKGPAGRACNESEQNPH